jgi:4-hydroxybenzoate polyprenyltransferase
MSTARGFKALKVYLEMIKFEHSIFVLPFAMIGMMWGAGGWPGWRTFLLIVVAMVSCRSAAMAFNRIADRDIDAVNPRTQMRAIPAGLLQLRQVNLFLFASCAIFFVAAWQLNPLSLMLSPVALVVVLGYSMTKRFTVLCHFVLGFSMGIGPAAAWIATTGRLAPPILPIAAAVTFWGAGFDIIYSLQDEDFDREQHLRSLPETLGKRMSLAISRVCHLLSVCLLAYGGYLAGAGTVYFIGVAFAAALLVYEQSLVNPHDLSRVNMAFFTLNGFVSIGIFGFALADRLVRR